MEEGTGSPKVYFIGAGPGDPELLTLRGQRLLAEADVVVYAGSLIPKATLNYACHAQFYDSAGMTLEEIMSVMITAAKAGKKVIRLASGDPSIYGALGEQTERLRAAGIDYEIIPGVSSFMAAAAVLGRELTVPDVVQTIILTRSEGRTKLPSLEELSLLAAHKATLVIFLSAHLIEKIQKDLLTAYPSDTPCAVVYKATWPDQKIVRCSLSDLATRVRQEEIVMTAIVIVGEALRAEGKRSKLYDPEFSHSFRRKKSASNP